MNKIWNSIPPLTSDYSGVCSMLFELNSLNILYTPSGCIHPIVEVDEIRSPNDMFFYKTNLSDIDVIMGVEDRFLKEVELLVTNNPRVEFISIIGTPVSNITNVDFQKIAEKLEKKTNKPVIVFDTNGFESYNIGIYEGLLQLAKRFSKVAVTNPKHVNVIGYSPLSLGYKYHLDELVESLENMGLKVTFFAERSLKSITEATKAAINLVITPEGMGVGEYFKEEFQIPFLMDLPIGLNGISRVFRLIETQLNIDRSRIEESISPVLELANSHKYLDKSVLVIGEPLTCIGVYKCLRGDFGISKVKAISNFNSTRKARRIYNEELFSQVIFVEDEENIMRYIKEADIIIADPLYRNFIREEEKKLFIPFPHIGLSGREFTSMEYEYIGKTGFGYFKKYLNPRI
ncbi:nitrogenase component 1 [Inediibacterium massiliense]|uniref:nitrogenase component 1 n=1 Tax=Inediibacterium massiliense TaxID=1658111 RepID=UPI0006B4EAB9|nr:nitrogenase component 1 [Inediibacterium massiliense]